MKSSEKSTERSWWERNSMKVYTCSKLVEFTFFVLFSIYIARELVG